MSRRGIGPVLLALALAAACDAEQPPVPTADLPVGRPDLPTPDQIVENGEHTLTVAGVKKAVLTAEQLYFYDQSGKVYGDTIQVNFFDESGTFVSMLTAKTGEIDRSSQDMISRGDVFVRGRDATIRTEELRYDPRANLITSDEPTVITQAGNTIRGQGVESDPGLERIRIRGGSAILRSEPDPGGGRRQSPRDAARERQRREEAEAGARDTT